MRISSLDVKVIQNTLLFISSFHSIVTPNSFRRNRCSITKQNKTKKHKKQQPDVTLIHVVQVLENCWGKSPLIMGSYQYRTVWIREESLFLFFFQFLCLILRNSKNIEKF